MPITIGSNINSLSAVRGLDRATGDLSSVYERLASGQRINRASDDAAGLAVSSSLNAKARIYSQGIRNVNDGLSLVAIAEGALTSLRDIVTRVSELSEQAASGSYSPKQRNELDREADSLLKEYNRIIQSTAFNGMKILDGSQESIRLQHGIGTEQSTAIAIGSEIGEADGNATYLAPISFATSGASAHLAVGDLNKDGIIDLVSTANGAALSAFIGNGDGTFKARTTATAGGTGVELGDLNGDGILDAASMSYGLGQVRYNLGNGSGGFSTPLSIQVETVSTEVKLYDVNSDGALDILSTGNSSMLSVMLGNGDGTFNGVQKYQLHTSTWQASQFTIGDFNGDGIADVASSAGAGVLAPVNIVLGNSDGTFSRSRSFNAGSSGQDISSVDFDGDGHLDLAVSVSTGVSILKGNGDGTFQARTIYAASGTLASININDMNGDGFYDVLSSDGLGQAALILGNGNATFNTPILLETGTGLTGVAAKLMTADFNGDGVKDVAFANNTNNTFSILLGNADSSGRRNNLVELVDLKNMQGARSALDWSKDQGSAIAREMGALGAFQSRLQSTLAVLETSRINSAAAASRITDADIADESSKLLATQIRQQLGQSVLAQANQQPRIALQLLGGI